jgi:hypothetical protein
MIVENDYPNWKPEMQKLLQQAETTIISPRESRRYFPLLCHKLTKISKCALA